MEKEDIAEALRTWGIVPSLFRPDVTIAGSPERCLERTVIEDGGGGRWVVERVDPRAASRKQEIASAMALFAGRLPEVKPYLSFAPGRFVAEREDGAWMVRPYADGVDLVRPDFVFEGWRGEALAGLLVRLRAAAAGIAGLSRGPAFSLPVFVRDLVGKLRDRERPILERVYPAVVSLERRLFPRLGEVPEAFCHGDLHPLNMVWSPTGIAAVIDWEFCGFRPEAYDAALLVGCVGMEDPRSLSGALVGNLIARLRGGAGFSGPTWETFFDLVLAVRFAWLSDWLRRSDREMVDLETVYIAMLLERREALEKAWG